MSGDRDDDSSEDTPYKVGYGKPPKDTRFKPGTSGNPKGRKARGTTVKARLQEKLHRLLKLSTGTTSTPLDIILDRAVHDLAAGNPGKWAQTLEFLGQFDPKQKFKPTSNDEERLNKLLADLVRKEPDGEE